MDAVRATSMNVRFGNNFSRNFLSPYLHLTSLPNLLSPSYLPLFTLQLAVYNYKYNLYNKYSAGGGI
jgi:hypothetical protein